MWLLTIVFIAIAIEVINLCVVKAVLLDMKVLQRKSRGEEVRWRCRLSNAYHFGIENIRTLAICFMFLLTNFLWLI